MGKTHEIQDNVFNLLLGCVDTGLVAFDGDASRFGIDWRDRNGHDERLLDILEIFQKVLMKLLLDVNLRGHRLVQLLDFLGQGLLDLDDVFLLSEQVDRLLVRVRLPREHNPHVVVATELLDILSLPSNQETVEFRLGEERILHKILFLVLGQGAQQLLRLLHIILMTTDSHLRRFGLLSGELDVHTAAFRLNVLD